MFLDTANLFEIESALKSGVFRGVTTNPTILHREKVNRDERIREILALSLPLLYVQVIGDTAQERLEDAEHLLSIGDPSIAIKIPLDQVGLQTVHEFKKKHPTVHVLGTAIYSATQGILGVLAGCDTLAPYVNRMLVMGVDPYGEIEAMRQFIDERDASTQIIAASFKQPDQVVKALSAGAHTCTLPYDIFVKMVDLPQAQEAIRIFNTHGKEVF
ncbi:MAG: transaldolase [Firmicutes bacterium GWF2_51_9]|nr:MAG: transaldolase [Firmicutes bacterium GWF2_51_9]OGS57601.1 MAG: transaldolase [Firmicutes bacterium GWE2_51_13]HBZ40876.1 transaldolase [Erysipelotrichaceae bacterium]